MKNQLVLTNEQLEKIGFKKHVYPTEEMNPERVTYEIECLNGSFYCNENQDHYKWYQKIKIGRNYNHIHLDIQNAPELFTILSSFRVKYNFFII